MRTFNNSDLFTGYLKQLLHNFNLPKIKVYTKQHERYLENYGEESPEILGTIEATPDSKVKTSYTEEELQLLHKNVRYFPYLKDGEIQEYINNKWQNIRENDIYVAPSQIRRFNLKTGDMDNTAYVIPAIAEENKSGKYNLQKHAVRLERILEKSRNTA